jgi:hypothetical protein
VAIAAPLGKPIWPIPPSTMGFRYENGISSDQTPVMMVTYDASVHGLGLCVSQFGTSRITHSVQAGDLGAEQVHREGEGCVRALTIALAWADDHGVSLQHKHVLIRGDCFGVLTAMTKGSYKSPVLQEQALRFNRLCYARQLFPSLLHITGEKMVELGIDGLSRDGAKEVHGPCVDDAMRKQIHDLAMLAGWDLTLDLFASKDNAVLPRYCSRFYEPTATWVDAFTYPCWRCRRCHHCSPAGSGVPPVFHEEVCLAFLPLHLPLHPVLRKAQSDGLKGIVVLSTKHRSSEFWKCFEQAAVPIATENPAIVKDCCARLGPLCTVDELAIFAVDFTLSRRPLLPPLTPTCARGGRASVPHGAAHLPPGTRHSLPTQLGVGSRSQDPRSSAVVQRHRSAALKRPRPEVALPGAP